MGKGDRRSRKGKIWKHSYGITRKRKKHKKPAFVPKVKKEKKITAPLIEKIVIPQVESIVTQSEQVIQQEVASTTGVEVPQVSTATEPIAVGAVKKSKPATKKKEPAVKKAKAAPKKKTAPATKKPAKKK